MLSALRAHVRADPAGALGATAVLVGVVALPLVFHAGQADAFAGPKIRTAQVITVLLLLTLAVAILRTRPAVVHRTLSIELPILIFLTGSSVALLMSIDVRQSFYGHGLQHQGFLATVMYVSAFYAGRALFGDTPGLRRLIRFVWLAGLAVATYGVAQRVGLDPFWGPRDDRRIFSSIGQPNALAAYLVTSTFAGLALAGSAATRWRRLGIYGSIGLLVGAVGLAGSRGGMLGLAAGLGVHCIMGSRKPTLRRTLVCGLVLAIGGSVFLSTSSLGRRSDHLSLWRVGIAITADHPLTGTGQETFPLVFSDYRDSVLDRQTARALAAFTPESPHNVYIGVAAGAGLVTLAGLVALIGFAATTIARRTLSTKGLSRALLVSGLAIAAGHLMTDAFMTPETAGTWTFWLLLGSALQAAQARK